MKVSPELANKIESALQKYISNPEPVWTAPDQKINLRVIASELKALPLYLDWDGAFGIRPNGDFFSFTYDNLTKKERIITNVKLTEFCFRD